jgi:hypothetical protein
MMVRISTVMVALWLCSGCGLFGGLRVQGLASGAQRPGNVATFVSVTDGDTPVTELGASDFTIYEDGKPLAPIDSGQRLLDRELAASYRVLLAVDTSTMTSPASRERLSKAIATFVNKIREFEAVTVVAFDGQATLKPLGDFARGESGPVEPSRFADLSPRDKSRNLNGAVVRAVAELESRLAQTHRALRVGALVLFSSGPDLAGRVDNGAVDDSLDAHSYAVISVGLGEGAANPLRDLGRDGFITAASEDGLGVAFEEAAYKVRSQYEKHYLLAYCSPARAGTRSLRIEVRYTNQKGEDEKGGFSSEFDARGFGPGCDPEHLPRLTAIGVKAANGAASDAKTQKEKDEDGPVILPPKRPGYAP